MAASAGRRRTRGWQPDRAGSTRASTPFSSSGRRGAPWPKRLRANFGPLVPHRCASRIPTARPPPGTARARACSRSSGRTATSPTSESRTISCTRSRRSLTGDRIAVAPRWEGRFRAPELSFPNWSRAAPERLVYESTESGVWQAHVHDLGTGRSVARFRSTPSGCSRPTPSCDGASVIWWQDETGDESGAWLSRAVAGGEQVHCFQASRPGGTKASPRLPA